MENNYRRTQTTVSLLNYHFVFCPRYRRKIFLNPTVEERFKCIAQEVCSELSITILAMECDKDHAHLFLNALPTFSPSDIMAKIKGVTSKRLRDEFPHLKHLDSLWTRSYFVSTAGNVSSETIKHYVENQKKGVNATSQVVTVKVKLLPTKEQLVLLTLSSRDYIHVINSLVSEMVEEKKSTKKTSAHVVANLPSAVKSQAILDAKSVFNTKVKKSKYTMVPVLKKPVCVWNNQNYSFDFEHISVPLIINGKSRRVPIRALLVDKKNRNFDLLKHKLGTLRITKISTKWVAQISVTIPTEQKKGTKILGVDLGLKVPAVAVTSDDKTKFFGNGRENKYMKRKFRSIRKKLGKEKKLTAIRNLDNKEQRWMKDKDHKVSREIVNFAIDNNISVIHLEQLTNIRQTTRTSRKNEKNLHTWSFYRLSTFIEYKENLAGIKVEYVNPAYTSQSCPCCCARNKAKDRKYICECGFKKHRDIVGAMNIRYAPVVDGKSQSA